MVLLLAPFLKDREIQIRNFFLIVYNVILTTKVDLSLEPSFSWVKWVKKKLQINFSNQERNFFFTWMWEKTWDLPRVWLHCEKKNCLANKEIQSRKIQKNNNSIYILNFPTPFSAKFPHSQDKRAGISKIFIHTLSDTTFIF